MADTARASGWGKPGAPGSPATTSSSPARERIATPFHAGSPWAATAYPRSASSSPSSAANASSASLVSWRQTTSGCRSSSQGSSRGTRCLTEFTFHVAIRTDPTVPAAARGYELRAWRPGSWSRMRTASMRFSRTASTRIE